MIRNKPFESFALVFSLLLASDDYIFACDADYYTLETVQKFAQVEKPETLLLASVLADWDVLREQDPTVDLPSPGLLQMKALQIAPDDEMVLNFIANGCYPSNPIEGSLGCNIKRATELTNLDPDNGFYWANLAHYQLGQGEIELALDSYRRAAEAPVFSIGWGEQVYRFTAAAQEVLATSTACSAEIAAGVTAGNLPAFQEFTDTCRALSGQEVWRQACIDLGLNMETKSQTMISRMIGFPLQRIAYEATGDGNNVKAIKVREEQLQTLVREQAGIQDCMDDPDWVDQWLANMREVGEMETLQRMRESVSQC
ncbi:MAG: hypothetical protein AAF699_10185 [Pseudomonadota bacterium]